MGGTDASELVTDPSSPYHGSVTKFENHEGSTGNPVTGIHEPDPHGGKEKYLVANLDETNRFAAIKFPTAPTAEERVLVFDYYKATEGIDARVCFNEIPDGCRYEQKDENIQVADRTWQTTKPIPIPPNTKVIYVATQNKEVDGDYHPGVFGIDNIQYLNPNLPPPSGSELPASACVEQPSSLASRIRGLRSRLARRFSRHV